MKDYIDYMIGNSKAVSRAKSAEKKTVLLNELYNKKGVRLSKKLSIKELQKIIKE